MKALANNSFCHIDSFVNNFELKYDILDYIPKHNGLCSEHISYKYFHKLVRELSDKLQLIPYHIIFPNVSGLDFLAILIAGLRVNKTILTHEKMINENTLMINSIYDILDYENLKEQPDTSGDSQILFFSSGSTGAPKIIRLTPLNIFAGAIGVFRERDNLIAIDGDSVMFCLPIYHIYEIIMELGMLTRGIPIYYTNPKELYVKYMEHKPSIMVVVPQILNNLYEKNLPLKLRILISGGAPVRDKVYDFYNKTVDMFVNGYGSTETSASVIVNGLCTLGSIVKIADDGELLVKGLVVSPFVSLDNEGWYHTNDLAKITEENKIEILGRKDSLTKLQQGEYINLDRLSDIYSSKDFITVVFANSLDRYPNAICFGSMTEEYYRENLDYIHKEYNLKGYERIDKIIIEKSQNILYTTSIKIDYKGIRKRYMNN